MLIIIKMLPSNSSSNFINSNNALIDLPISTGCAVQDLFMLIQVELVGSIVLVVG